MNRSIRCLSLVLMAGAACSVRALTNIGPAVPPGRAFDPSGIGVAVPVWNSPGRFETWAEGFRRAGMELYRFPNGSLSNEYHWNGVGTYDSTGIWRASGKEVGPGFTVRSRWRGTTKNNYDAILPSFLADGDTATEWWGETIQDTLLPWVVLDFKEARKVDSIEILWGASRPAKVAVQAWDGPAYPMPHNADPVHWREVKTVSVVGARTAFRFGEQGARYFAVRPGGIPKGVRVREIRMFRQGSQVTENVPDSHRQTKILAISTHPGSVDRNPAWVPEWTFDRFAQWLKGVPNGQALICVNYGTGTPEEAAAWVRYANVVKKYGIRRWHVGNEMDGDWEEGGPVDPAQYAARFVEFSRAMKAVDSTIEVYGPGTYSTDFRIRRSGRPDHLSWIESFLWRVGEVERRTGRKLLDGVDFHSYPYWFENGPASGDALLAACSRFGDSLEILEGQISKYLDHPETRKISLSEFNTTVKITSQTLDFPNGLGVASILNDLWSRHPDQARSIVWEPMGGEPMNPDGGPIESYGSLRLFTPPRVGVASDLVDPPTSTWWAQWIVRNWLGDPGTTVRPVATKGSGFRASLAGDSARWALLAINPSLAPETLAVRLPRSGASEIQTWGGDQYRWTDATSLAIALPNAGPVSRPWAAAESLVVVAPRSIALLRSGKFTQEKARVVHLGWIPGRLGPADTFVAHASVVAPGRKLTGASWRIGSASGPVASFDGAWDGSAEVGVVRLPATAIPRGIGLELKLSFAVAGAESLTVSVHLDNEDVPRPVAVLDDFDAPGMAASNGQSWWTYAHGSNATRMDVTRSADRVGGHFTGEFKIVQPPTLPYPNLALAGLNLAASEIPDFKHVRGLVFDLRTRHSNPSGKFVLQALTTTVKDYDDFRIELENTHGTWKRIWVRWTDLSQEGWGKGVGSYDPSTLRALQFKAVAEGDGVIELENLDFWATEGNAIPFVDPPRTVGRGRPDSR